MLSIEKHTLETRLGMYLVNDKVYNKDLLYTAFSYQVDYQIKTLFQQNNNVSPLNFFIMSCLSIENDILGIKAQG